MEEIVKLKKYQEPLTEQEYQTKLDKPCQSLYIAFELPWCKKQVNCILIEEIQCPEGRTLKEIK